MRDLFFKFIESPNADTYRAIRQVVVSSDRYSPYSDELSEVAGLIDSGRCGDARSRISESMPNLLLSPRAHLWLAMIAEKDGDEQAAQMERFLAAACAEGILATGDGSRGKPYLVLRTSDEHDLVQYLGKQFAQQALIEGEKQHFDVINCTDGTELWFDITDPFHKLQGTFGG